VKCLVRSLASGQVLLPALSVFPVIIIPPMTHTHFNILIYTVFLAEGEKGEAWEHAVK
jgi:hypothetical protein